MIDTDGLYDTVRPPNQANLPVEVGSTAGFAVMPGVTDILTDADATDATVGGMVFVGVAV